MGLKQYRFSQSSNKDIKPGYNKRIWAYSDTVYKNSEVWKCLQSPTGAHHWVIDGKLQHCQYCNVTKEIATFRYDTVKGARIK